MSDKENKTTETKENKHKKRQLKINSWMLVSIVLIIALAGIIIFYGMSGTRVQADNSQEIADKALTFINGNLVQPGTSASFVEVGEFEGLYNVTVSYQGDFISIFMTKDGDNMFLSAPLNIEEIQEEIAQAPVQEQPTEVTKTEKPTVQLFVMSFCPYGIQAETAMEPVIALLGDKADIQVHFIASVTGDTPDSINSLHGAPEAEEDLRQVCMIKYYDKYKFWAYVTKLNSECASMYRDAAAYDPCWKAAAEEFGMDVSTIEACASGSEGVDLLKVDNVLTSSLGVTGSPTMFINGLRYGGARTPESYKAAICDTFITPPAECSEALDTTGTAAAGSC
ncbi:MAG: hypothetical protein ABIE55_04350 [Candidatus Aenigmatarchaeota archaeon]